MIRKMLICAALLCGTIFGVRAQGVAFQDLTFQQALDKAAAEDKLVFMDCYTSWCGPCKNMLNNVFTLPEAGEFMNAAFVCVKYDMEKGEGVELRKRFGVRAFPTFFIIRPDGTVQHKLVGGSQWGYFQTRVERGLNEKTSLHYLDGRYQSGKLSAKEYADYAKALRDASEDKRLEDFCLSVFGKLNDKSRCQAGNWFIFEQEMQPTDERFVYLVEHKAAFDRAVGTETVDKQLNAVYGSSLPALRSAQQWIEPCGVIAGQLEKVEFEGKPQTLALLNYVVAAQSRDVEATLACLEADRKLLPPFVTYDLFGALEFVVNDGTNEQVERFIRVGRQAEEEAENENVRQLLKATFDRYQGDLDERMHYAEVKGRVTRRHLEKINLYEVVDGKEHLISTTELGKDGYYGFAFQPAYAGFYVVGGKESKEKMRLYLKPGDSAELNFTEDSMLITSRNTPENLLLARWEALMIPVRARVDDTQYALFDYRDFFPYFMAFLPKADEFKENIRFHNEDFAELVRQTVDFDLDYYAFRILNALKAGKETLKPSRPTPADYPAYYDNIVEKGKLSDASLLKQPYGYDFLLRYTTFACGGFQAKISLEQRLEWLPDDLLKAEVILWQMEHSRKYEDYIALANKYADYLTTDNHHKRMEAVSAKLYKGTAGTPAADFTCPDRNGKMVSLSDFRGKVVVVDVWATWCGPCRQEIPHLVKLEKEMEGKDVVFIGVSVDEKKDYQKWLDVLEKEGLGGVQLFADGWGKKITNDYKITGIPRFMVFDKKGNVVATKAPRPSSPALKALLEKELKK